MAYLPHARVVFRGTILGLEEWSTSCALGSSGLPTQAGLDGLAAAGLSAMNAWFALAAAAGGGWSTVVQFNRVDAYAIREDGRAEGQAEAVNPTPVSGVGTPAQVPQVSVVASLRTGFPGRSRRGRMYLPLLGQPNNSALDLNVGTRGAIGQEAVDLLNALSAVPDGAGTFVPVVASGVGNGALTAIESVFIGSRFDTQRRRRNSLPEVFTAVPL